jgi:hypothetical protein
MNQVLNLGNGFTKEEALLVVKILVSAHEQAMYDHNTEEVRAIVAVCHKMGICLDEIPDETMLMPMLAGSASLN